MTAKYLTDKQRAVYNVIVELTRKLRRPPTYREVNDRFGYKSINALAVFANALKAKGYLRQDRRLVVADDKFAVCPCCGQTIPRGAESAGPLSPRSTNSPTDTTGP